MDTNKVKNQFNSDAKIYDKKRRKFISCYDDYYINSTKFITSIINEPKMVLDLGAGTGLLTSFWYREFPNARYVLDDISEEMLNMAKERFTKAVNVEYVKDDYNQKLPDGDFDTIISALSIHHLDNDEKERLFKRIFDRLPKGGVFVNYDMFNAETKDMTERYNRYWEKSVLSCQLPVVDVEHWKKGRSIDKECSVNEEILLLKNAGFSEVNCVYLNLKFGIILAVK